MRCGRISVEGEAEEVIPVSPRAAIKPRQRHGKKSSSSQNPYSARGLDTFASLNAELSAKREYVAKKIGTPEALVRFVYSRKGWIPLVVKIGADGDPRVSILAPVRTQPNKDANTKNNSSSKDEEDDKNNEVEAENDVSGSGSQAAVPWTGYLKTTAFGVLTVSALLARKSAVPAAAMAVVMVVCDLQRRWQGGVMCMKRFIEGGVSYFSDLFSHWKKNPEIETVQRSLASSPEHEVVDKKVGLTCLSAPTSPVKSGPLQPTVFAGSQELKGCKNNKKKCARILSMDSQPRKPIRLLQQSESFQLISQPRKPMKLLQQSESFQWCSQSRKPMKSLQQSESFQCCSQSKKPMKLLKQSESFQWSSQPGKPRRLLQHSESFQRRRRAGVGTIDGSVGAIVMIIILFCLVFYGRLCAICFTSVWWYVLPNLRTKVSNNRNINKPMDIRSREYRKKVIMEGLLDRNQGKAMWH